ncbi:multidrug transporter [Neptunitalea chrysea]|uniref:Multidrug transporter n=2 Tax=Neptunitalea chrysea TaxID=1647581 RepID=A0A9W6EVT3_9FLAO|nr:multidrug transporter [Neptunitalea chrysea]
MGAFLKSGLLVVFLKGIGAGLSFFSLVLVTKFFNKELVGQFNYLNSMLILLSSIAVLGTQDAFLKFAGKLEAEGNFYKVRDIYFKKVGIILVTSSILLGAYLLFYVFDFQILDKNLEKVLLKAFLGVFFLSLSILNFRAIRGLKQLMASEIFGNLVRYGLVIVMVYAIHVFGVYNYLLDGVILALILLATTTSLYVFRLLQNLKKDTPIHLRHKTDSNNSYGFKDIIKTSYPMTISFLTMLIMQSADVIILEHYHSFNIVAYYGVIVKVSSVTSIVLLAVNSIVAPDIAKYFYSGERDKLLSIINKSIKMNVYLTIPVLIMLFLIPKTILGFFGTAYTEAYISLLICTFGQFINVFSGSVGVYLNMTGRQFIFQRILLVALVLNLILNIYFIPDYGMNGAAVSTAISMIFWNLLAVYYVYRKDKILFFYNFK